MGAFPPPTSGAGSLFPFEVVGCCTPRAERRRPSTDCPDVAAFLAIVALVQPDPLRRRRGGRWTCNHKTRTGGTSPGHRLAIGPLHGPGWRHPRARWGARRPDAPRPPPALCAQRPGLPRRCPSAENEPGRWSGPTRRGGPGLARDRPGAAPRRWRPRRGGLGDGGVRRRRGACGDGPATTAARPPLGRRKSASQS